MGGRLPFESLAETKVTCPSGSGREEEKTSVRERL